MIVLANAEIATNWSTSLYGLGNTLLLIPNFIWIVASNKIVSAALNKPPSSIVTGLATIFVFAGGASFSLFSLLILPEGNPVIDLVLPILFLTMFAALITASIMVSRRVLDTQECPKTGRGSRLFVLCLCFFYIAIGMFFIAPKLKKISAKVVGNN